MKSNKQIQIGPVEVGEQHPPFIVAEMSGNHNGSLERALNIVDAAAEAGADALKLQTYTADTMTIDCDGPGFRIEDPKSPWVGRALYELYQEAHTPWEWHSPIMERCRERGLVFFSTPFDATSVAFLEELDVPAYKIASFENGDVGLLRLVAETGKPVIMSTGTVTLEELDESVRVLREAGCQDLILLKCTSAYPAPPESVNLRTLPQLRERYGAHVGLSDHTMGCAAAIASVALGAEFIEKHFTLSREDGGVDAAFSLEPDELAGLVQQTKIAWKALGSPDFRRGDAEASVFRRSIYIVKNMLSGDVLTEECIRVIRPGYGLPPSDLTRVLGRTLVADASRGTPLSWSLLSE